MPVIPIPGARSSVLVSPQAARYQVTQIADHTMVTVPGAVFAMGSKLVHDIYHNAPPHMVKVSPVRVAITPITEAQFRDVMGRSGFEEAPGNFPASRVSFRGFEEYMMRVNRDLKPEDQIGFLTEAEGEHAARGPAVDVRQFMEEKGLKTRDQLAEHLRNNCYYLENFIDVDPFKNPKEALALGKNICTDIESEWFDRLINGTGPVFAWRTFATLSGRLTKEEAWYGEEKLAPVSLVERVNAFGLSDMIGNIWEWREDIYDPEAYLNLPSIDPVNLLKDVNDDGLRVVRGGSYIDNEDYLRAALRHLYHPELDVINLGCRVGSAPPRRLLSL